MRKFMFATMCLTASAISASALADDVPSTIPGVVAPPAPTEPSLAQQAMDAANTPSLPPFNRAPIAAASTTPAPAPAPAPVPVIVSTDSSAHDRSFRAGFDLSLGVPSVAEAGFVFQPWTHWTRLELGLTHGVANTFGGMASATFTPIKFPIMPVLQVEAGFMPQATLPSFIDAGKTLPTLGYDWVSVGPGLEFGSRDSAVFFIHPSMTYMHATLGNFQSFIDSNGGSDNVSGLQVGSPVVNGWIPTGRIGFAFMF